VNKFVPAHPRPECCYQQVANSTFFDSEKLPFSISSNDIDGIEFCHSSLLIPRWNGFLQDAISAIVTFKE